MTKIKYCVWDVGNVIYDYTITPLNDWCEQHTTDKETFKKNKGKFSYNNYMKGLIPFPQLCQEICEFYGVPYRNSCDNDIKKAFFDGIIKYHPQTRKIQEHLKNSGVKNCILSNALPILADTCRCDDLISPQYQFCSFNLGLLKPDAEIFKTVRTKLGCEFQELIFVDDKKENTDAAAELGIHAITFNPETIKDEIYKIIG